MNLWIDIELEGCNGLLFKFLSNLYNIQYRLALIALIPSCSHFKSAAQ